MVQPKKVTRRVALNLAMKYKKENFDLMVKVSAQQQQIDKLTAWLRSNLTEEQAKSLTSEFVQELKDDAEVTSTSGSID